MPRKRRQTPEPPAPAETAFEYHSYFHPLIVKWIARWGFSEKEIASELGVPANLLEDWKVRYPAIDAALKDGRKYWLELAESGLQKVAKGYTYDETVIDIDVVKGQGGIEGDQAQQTPTKIKKITRYVGPNTQALIFLIQNRMLFKLAKQIQDSVPQQVRENFQLPPK